jgi:Flp pilus assembly protein CpaB
MRHTSQRPGVSLMAMFVLVIVGLSVVSGGTILALGATGVIDLPFMRRPVAMNPDMQFIPISSNSIPAYTKITRDHIWDSTKGVFSVTPVHKSVVTSDMFTSFEKFKGRVLGRDKPKGYAFTESDFLPKGTREGIVAGIPPGKRSVVLDASKLNGVFGLRAGDHIDILASQKLDLQKNKAMTGPHAAFFTAQKQASTRVIVQDGVIVLPVTSRAKPITSNSLTQGTQSKTVPVQEVTIAVNPEEVAPLNSALAVESQLNCVARSGQMEVEEAPKAELNDKSAIKALEAGPRKKPASLTSTPALTPHDNPLESLTFMEGLIGSKRGTSRQQLIFPKAGRGPIDLNPIAPSQPRDVPPPPVPDGEMAPRDSTAAVGVNSRAITKSSPHPEN